MPGLAEIVRLRTADCRQAAAYLPVVAAGEAGDDGASARAVEHIGSCLRCQAEVAAYRRILRHLRALRHDEVPSPPGALAAVLAALEAAEGGLGEQSASSRALRVAYVGGITMATAAAGAAGVLVWLSRRRTGLAATG
jgi:hypothetical protein